MSLRNIVIQLKMLKAQSVLIVLLFTPLSSHAYQLQGKLNQCATLFHGVKASATVRNFKTLNDIFLAFTEGFSPNLKDPDQRIAFELYLRVRFGNPNAFLKDGTVEILADVIAQYSNLERGQPRFLNYELEVNERVYPITSSLSQFLRSHIKKCRSSQSQSIS